MITNQIKGLKVQHCLESVLMTIWWTTRIIIHDNCYQWIKRAMKLSTTCKLIKIKKNLLKDQRAPLFNVCIRGPRKFCLIHFVIEIYLHLTVDLEDYVIFCLFIWGEIENDLLCSTSSPDLFSWNRFACCSLKKKWKSHWKRGILRMMNFQIFYWILSKLIK